MEKIYFLYLPFAYIFVLISAEGKGACSRTGSPCSANRQCCPISNGKSYCNLKSKSCEALRYCDVSSSNGCPFNDLSAEEIKNVIEIIKKSKSFSAELLFPIVRKQEPKKKSWNAGVKAAKQRVAMCLVYDLGRNLLSEVVVSLSDQRIVSVKSLTDSLAPISSDEYTIAEEVLKNDPRIKRAYERRGLNVTYAAFDIWAFGAQTTGNVIGRRRVKLVANYKDPGTKYMDYRPVEGLSATIDIADRKIVDFIDKGNVPVPKAPRIPDSPTTPSDSEHSSESLPESPIEINGYQIKWHNWKFQYSMDPIYGLQAYHIRYVADCAERFLIYKLSISEMFVPYGGDGETWRWRGAFDAGEYGLGKTASRLMRGIDVPMNAELLSCPQVDDSTGEVNELEGCIAVYERDASPVYKHYDKESDADESMLGTEMIMTFMCTVGNYDYMFDLIFTMDGNIEVSVSLTGILLAKGVLQEKNDPDCIEDCQDFINGNAVAPLHQHFFNYRIDFDIDGANNMVTEVDFANDPKGPENADGGAFSLRRTIIHEETFRDFSAPNARFWSVINPQSRNKFNTPRGYSLHPGSLGSTFLKPGSPLNQALFTTHPIWITAYNDKEQAAAGTLPRSGKAGQGLPEYVKNHESLDNSDVVVWHTFAVTHAPRPEEYPFMDKMHFGFHILSRNFQSANPNVIQCETNSK